MITKHFWYDLQVILITPHIIVFVDLRKMCVNKVLDRCFLKIAHSIQVQHSYEKSIVFVISRQYYHSQKNSFFFTRNHIISVEYQNITVIPFHLLSICKYNTV